MKIELAETSNAGERNPLNIQYTANGKRITREEFQDTKRKAARLDTFYQVKSGGRETFYCTATIE